jgi:hypothetical protein
VVGHDNSLSLALSPSLSFPLLNERKPDGCVAEDEQNRGDKEVEGERGERAVSR